MTNKDYVSQEAVIEWLKDKDIIKTKNQEENARRELAFLSSVISQQPCEDCISRKEVKRILADQRDELIKLHTVNSEDNPKADAMAYGVNWSLNTLMELPSVTPSYNSVKTELKPCEDCISREAVIDAIDDIESEVEDGDGFQYAKWREYFCELPSAQPKTGHWCRKTKVDAYDIAGVKTWGIKCQCDRCAFATIVVEDFGYYKYCPNCGAKMESEDKK